MTGEAKSADSPLIAALPVIPILAGFVILGALAFCLHAPVHIAGDGALKQYLLRGWIESGEITSKLEWTSPQQWARELWEQFHFPFEAPFVHEGRAVFPPFFLVLSLPAFLVFGYPGLFVLPALSMIGMWLVAWGALRRMDVRGLHAALALSILVLSPLTFFGMMFWEHTPGLFALLGAFLMLMRRGEARSLDALAGFLLALAVMLRPELVAAAAVVLGFACVGSPRRVCSLVGVATGIAVWAAGNLVTTGTPFGIHAEQELYLAGGNAFGKLMAYYSGVGVGYTAGAAGAAGGLVLAAVFFRRDDAGLGKLELCLLLMVGFSLAVLPFMVPYSGEYMGFRRFELLLIPAGAILAGRMASRYRWATMVLLALSLLQGPRFVRQFEVFRWASGPRLLPVMEAIERESPSVIVGDSQFTAIELSSLMGSAPLVWAAPPDDLIRLLGEVDKRTDLRRAALVFWKPGASAELTIPVPGRGGVRWVRHAGDDEGFALFMPAGW